jgi:hypothetical protein
MALGASAPETAHYRGRSEGPSSGQNFFSRRASSVFVMSGAKPPKVGSGSRHALNGSGSSKRSSGRRVVKAPSKSGPRRTRWFEERSRKRSVSKTASPLKAARNRMARPSARSMRLESARSRVRRSSDGSSASARMGRLLLLG